MRQPSLRLVEEPELTNCLHCDRQYDRVNCGYDEEFCSEDCLDADREVDGE